MNQHSIKASKNVWGLKYGIYVFYSIYPLLYFCIKIMSKVIFFLLLLSLTICQICDLDRCDECDFTIDPVICKTCHGWYESNWDTGLCVLSARLIIATIAGGIIFICVIICTVVKISDYREKITRRPTNIESLESPSQANEEELNQLVWRKSG